MLQLSTDKDNPTIPWIVNQLKGIVSKRAGKRIWQKGFYDQVIRTESEFRMIGEYIGRIYISLNRSPQYVIRETINVKDD